LKSKKFGRVSEGKKTRKEQRRKGCGWTVVFRREKERTGKGRRPAARLGKSLESGIPEGCGGGGESGRHPLAWGMGWEKLSCSMMRANLPQ